MQKSKYYCLNRDNKYCYYIKETEENIITVRKTRGGGHYIYYTQDKWQNWEWFYGYNSLVRGEITPKKWYKMLRQALYKR